MNDQTQVTDSTPDENATPQKPRRRWKPSAKARKAKARRKLIQLDAASPWLAQLRTHAGS